MKLIISNIDWDCEYPDENLPTTIVIDDPLLLPHLLEDIDGYAENCAEWLSNEYGWCVKGFTTDVEGLDR